MALSISADRLLIDDWYGRLEAARRRLSLPVTFCEESAQLQTGELYPLY
jgi:hypothetical protein